ncbi:MAG: hypothetical protein WAV93_07390 [Bacteroidales bacterium]
MVRRISSSKLKQAIDKHNSAVRKYNQAARKYNQDRKRAIENYNNQVRRYNAAQREKRNKLNHLISVFNQRPPHRIFTTTITLRQSTETLKQKYLSLQSVTDTFPNTSLDNILIDQPETELNNSIILYNSLTGIQDGVNLPEDNLQRTLIEDALYKISPELEKRWNGALFSLSPDNPDAARHFCTSVREIYIKLLDIKAPDDIVKVIPGCTFYNNRPDRRSKIKYLLSQKSITINQLTEFIGTDIDDLLELFNLLNAGTHGESGRYPIQQLLKLKKRAEDAIIFMTSIIS